MMVLALWVLFAIFFLMPHMSVSDTSPLFVIMAQKLSQAVLGGLSLNHVLGWLVLWKSVTCPELFRQVALQNDGISSWCLISHMFQLFVTHTCQLLVMMTQNSFSLSLVCPNVF